MATVVKYGVGQLDAAALESEVSELWSRMGTDPELRDAVEVAGIDLGSLATLDPGTAIRFETEGKGFGTGAELILVGLAADIVRDLWKQVLLPRIRARRGLDAVGPEVEGE